MDVSAKTYRAIDRLEKFGEKSGLVVNRKLTLLGALMAGALIILVFGTVVLLKAFFKNVTKK